MDRKEIPSNVLAHLNMHHVLPSASLLHNGSVSAPCKLDRFGIDATLYIDPRKVVFMGASVSLLLGLLKTMPLIPGVEYYYQPCSRGQRVGLALAHGFGFADNHERAAYLHKCVYMLLGKFT